MTSGVPRGSRPNQGAVGTIPPKQPLPQLADLVRNAAEGTVVVDPEGIVLFANPAAETLLGRAPGGAIGLALGYPAVSDEPTVITLRRPGSDTATVELRAAETSWGGGSAFVVNLHDITARLRVDNEKRQLQERSDHLNQVLRAIAAVNQVIIREPNPGRLIRAVCDRLVIDGGLQASWLVLTNEDGSVVDTAHSQLAAGGLSALTKAFAQGVVPECCRRAHRERRVVRSEGTGGSGACAPLVPTQTALTACLAHGERAFGYITIFFDPAGDGDGEEERLLHTIAGDLGFALHSEEESLAWTRTQRLLEDTERVAEVGGWEWDLTTDEFTVSDQWRRIHGCGDVPITLSDVIALCFPEDQGRWAASLESLRDGCGPIDVDHRIVALDSGDTRVLRSRSGTVEEGGSGKKTVRGTAQDITAAHASTEHIRFQARLLEVIGEAVIVTEPEGKILFWNDAARKLYGWSAEEVLGTNIKDIATPEIAETVGTAWEFLTAGKTWFGESVMQNKDGHRFPTMFSAAPVFGGGGEFEAIIGVTSDLTERVRAEEDLRAASRKLDAAVVGGRVGLWDWDLDTDEVSYSAEWKRQIGYAEDEITNDFEEWRSRVHPEDLDRMLELINTFVAGGQEDFRAEFRFRHKDGSYRSILAQADILRGDDDRPVRLLVGSHVDLTELRQIEEDHQQVAAQLQQSQKMESVGRLAGGVAHDFNNVLGVILGITELSLLRDDLTGQSRADLQEIQQAGTRAATLTRQLLAFARRQTIHPQVVDLNETVEGMIKMLRRLIGEDLKVTWTPGRELWPVKVDPAQVDQILANLAVNARDAIEMGSRDKGGISLETTNVELDQAFCDRYPGAVPGGYVVLSVSDNGVGMDKASLAKAFEPFFTTKPAGKGTGLGLATVYGIVKQNAGFVNIYSEVGEGTTVRVYLPRLIGARMEPGTRSEARNIVGGTETLLVVEDDDAMLRIVSRILEKLGYTLLVTESPHDALELVRQRGGTIDLLMTDVVMPGMTGRELSEAALALKPDLKCLFVSGYTQDVISRQGVLEEGVHFLEKPFTAAGLATTVRRTLDDPNVG